MCASPDSADPRVDELELNLLADRIGELARVIDLGWQRAQQKRTTANIAIALAEASQGLHRARIALASEALCLQPSPA